MHLQQGLYACDEDFDARSKPAQYLHEQQMLFVYQKYLISVHNHPPVLGSLETSPCGRALFA